MNSCNRETARPAPGKADMEDPTQATLQVIGDSLAWHPSKVKEDLKLLINFTEQSILDKVPHLLPPHTTVIELPDLAEPSEGLMAQVRELKDKGFLIALDGFESATRCGPLVKLADVVKIDVLGKHALQVTGMIRGLKSLGVSPLLIAKRVEDMAHYRMAREQGFTLFQGFFFREPEILPSRKVPTAIVTRLKLLRLIEDRTPDIESLVEAIHADAKISLRLLSFLNSPYFDFLQRINSVKQAVLLLGWEQIRDWLRVIVLTETASREKSSELPYLSAQRGKFLELTVSAHDLGDSKAEVMFQLGLFSLLEPLLDMPMKDIMDGIPLNPEIKDALCDGQGPFAPWLAMVESYEQGDWDQVEALVEHLGLDPTKVAMAYHESLIWAKGFFEFLVT